MERGVETCRLVEEQCRGMKHLCAGYSRDGGEGSKTKVNVMTSWQTVEFWFARRIKVPAGQWARE